MATEAHQQQEAEGKHTRCTKRKMYVYPATTATIPAGYDWALYVSVDAERREGETFEQCAARLNCPPQAAVAEWDEFGNADADRPHAQVLQIERDVQELHHARDLECRRRRIEKRNAELRKIAQAQRHGQSFSAVYSRKVDVHGNSTPVVCMKWLEGLCMFGNDCPELHTLDASYIPACAFFMSNGVCGRADCMFKHVETRQYYSHCRQHLLGSVCTGGDSCPDMHVSAKFGAMKHKQTAQHITDEERRAMPQELCAAPTYSHAYTPRVADPNKVVRLCHLVSRT